MATIKIIICYVNEIIDFGIWYSKDTNMNLAGLCNTSCIENAGDRKSTSRGCFNLGNNLISWHNKKQNSISLLTTKAKSIAFGSYWTQLLWMKHMLEDYGIVLDFDSLL